jgi:hypothetical protein
MHTAEVDAQDLAEIKKLVSHDSPTQEMYVQTRDLLDTLTLVKSNHVIPTCELDLTLICIGTSEGVNVYEEFDVPQLAQQLTSGFERFCTTKQVEPSPEEFNSFVNGLVDFAANAAKRTEH